MGCTGEKTYEQAVKEELRRYLHSLNISSIKEKEINNYISQDLTRKAAALNNYQYLYRDEDAKETAEEYKMAIMERFHVGNSIYEQKLNAINNNNINNNDNNDNNNKYNKDNKDNKDLNNDNIKTNDDKNNIITNNNNNK